MKKILNRKDFAAIGILLFLSLAVMLSCLLRKNVYGSQEDWASQHYAIPEYFRMLFYNTHQLFPSYAPNIGAGENIYVLSYYGLYSPIILISYLLPFLSMGMYIMAAGILIALFSECAFYVFLRKRFCTRTCFFTSLFFTFSLPLILHTHRHIMFLTFIPFLILSMHLTDLYFRSGKRSPLVISTALMILCNYFFACSALCALSVYGLFCILEEKQGKFSLIIKKFIPFLLLLLTAVLISAFLLMPTGATLFTGRDKTAGSISYRNFLPSIHYDWLTYYGYTMGSTAFGIFASLYYLINGKHGKRFLAAVNILFAVCPCIIYFLNGMLYFDAKVLFAFLPSALLLNASFAEKLFAADLKKIFVPSVVFAVSSVLSGILCGLSLPVWAFIIDAALIGVTLIIISFRKKAVRISYLCLAVPILVCITGNHIDPLQTREIYDLVNSPTVAKLTKELSDQTMVRTAIDTNRLNTVNKIYDISHYQDTIYSSIHSRSYNQFYLEEMYNENQFRNAALTTRSRNVLFNVFMGNRYYISNEPVHFYGYEQIQKTPDGFCLYENPNVFPMLYSSDLLMSVRQYRSLSYPYNIEALMRFRIVEDDIPDAAYESMIQPAEIGDCFCIERYLTDDELKTASFENGTDRFTLHDCSRTYTYPLPESVRGKILMIRVHVDNPKESIQTVKKGWERTGDVRIKINGVKNTLTDKDWKYYNHNEWFEFVLSDDSDHLEIELTGKNIELSQLKVYTLDPAILHNTSAALTPFEPDLSRTKGDVIEGTINSPSDGYFTGSLLYHKGFTVTVDGETVTPEKTNLAFLGFPLKAGSHHIRIEYRAPMLDAGLAVSGIGCLILLCLIIIDIGKAYKNKHRA